MRLAADPAEPDPVGLTLLCLTLLVLLALRRRSLGLIALPPLALGWALALIG